MQGGFKMKKLNQEQINEIIRLKEQGKKSVEIARLFKVHSNVILYHTNPNFKKRLIEYNKKRYQEMTKEQKDKYFEKKKEYQREYQRKRYKQDKQFREKQLQRSKKYQNGKSIEVKGGVL